MRQNGPEMKFPMNGHADISAIRCRILTTTACNAGCAYCYEKGIKPLWMNEETADRTASFLVDRMNEGMPLASLEWFGGEPLLNPEAADRICTQLAKECVPFRSSVVTNGLLLGRTVSDDRISLWRLRQIQVTLDGTAPVHEAVKGFPGGSFRNILENIRLMTRKGLRVKFRLNYSGNYEDMSRLISVLGEDLSGNNRCSVYLSPIYSCQKSYPREIMLDILQMNELLVQEGLVSRRDLYPLDERQTRCFMMTPGGFTIAPDGKLYNCSHAMTEEQCVGTIWDYTDSHPVRKAFLEDSVTQECLSCEAFLICRGGCRIAELGLSEMTRCHPYRNVLPEIKSILNQEEMKL